MAGKQRSGSGRRVSSSKLNDCLHLLVRSALVSMLVAPSIFFLFQRNLLDLFSFVDRDDSSRTPILAYDTSAEVVTRSSLHPFRDESPYLEPRVAVKKLLSVEQAEGDGAFVRRSIGRPEMKQLDPFLLLDHFAVAPPAGFPDHPHRGFETVTYMLEGSFTHQDFAGHKGTIGPGDLQWMTAGRGIVHSELPAKPGVQRGLQLWVNLPGKYKMVEPKYQEIDHQNVAKVDENGVEVKVIAGESHGIKSPVYTLTPIMFLDFSLKPGAVAHQDIPQGWNAFIYVLEGKVTLGTKTATPVSAFHTIQLGPGNGLSVWNTQDKLCRYVLIGGEPLGEPVVQYGPFVMNTEKEIRQAMQDFRSGRNGFEKSQTWRSSPIIVA
ncbi:quercetin 2,3-dioxygenase [Marchantia polymorpha subsp. ruderalis]|uniref:Pirin-like protein n=2 Tax=Marchantia polymorpha TaxID=3197 RepID=A0A176VXX6_MARPO|nr:hypothetical protein AXG93_4368s1170 [Marchantia polymorpha subsp. ruderalis]PTQ41598.1 hypothetical protein MARPO_0033s0019 [Marchantia polymorpha]BBM98805.1 hypothetical protein Mp_1g16410 [Marchantia polymorpha subsp. ruderalis]|eukprot:PTQ41598.1 hypothetical protein MARPO_0033s0019 [Marchantia polymorpha]